MLEDGTPINASTYLDFSTHYTPRMARLERVEVLRANGLRPGAERTFILGATVRF